MQIDFYGDLTCHWCYLGWQRLHAALMMRPDLHVSLHYRPYQLNPDVPLEGMDRTAYLLQKFSTPERVQDVLLAGELALKADGINAHLSRMSVTAHAGLAHRLLCLAQNAGRLDAYIQAVFVAVFVQLKNISQPSVLVQIAQEVGLNMQDVRHSLTALSPPAWLTESQQQAQQLGIRAVPHIVLNHRYSLAGAHDAIAFLPLLDLCAMEEA